MNYYRHMYVDELLDDNDDDGTMVQSKNELSSHVVGHKIVAVEHLPGHRFTITLDTGKAVELVDTHDCCAYTSVDAFMLHPDMVDHVITGVGTTGEYTSWHIYADMGDILRLAIGWSCGNPFYYAYGFQITVKELT